MNYTSNDITIKYHSSVSPFLFSSIFFCFAAKTTKIGTFVQFNEMLTNVIKLVIFPTVLIFNFPSLFMFACMLKMFLPMSRRVLSMCPHSFVERIIKNHFLSPSLSLASYFVRCLFAACWVRLMENANRYSHFPHFAPPYAFTTSSLETRNSFNLRKLKHLTKG